MRKSFYLWRVFLSIFLNGTFQIGLMDVLYFYVTGATLRELKYILLYPLPMAYPLIGSFCVFIGFHCKPILEFLDAENKGLRLDRERIFAVQNRLINLPYYIAGASFPAFIIGGILATFCINYKTGWPYSLWIYGFYGGFFAGALAIPTAIFAIDWANQPVLDLTISQLETRDASRSAGYRLTLRNKFIMNTLALVLSIAGYCVILGYSQTNNIYRNMIEMESLVPAEARATLADDISGASDPRVRSSIYFEKRMGNLRIFFLGLMGVGLAIASITSLAVARQIARPVQELREVAERVKNGSYADAVRIVSNEEFADLGAAFNRMTSELKSKMEKSESLLKSIQSAAIMLAPTSRDMSAIAQRQSSSAVQQASAAEEAAASSAEIAAMARQIAENAAMASNLAEEWLAFSRGGRDKLDRATSKFAEIETTMSRIVQSTTSLEDRSTEIDKIATTIEELSERTHLLSLNASLEAAGVKGQGNRFAVVAKEVRRLASSAAESTARIRELTSDVRDALMRSSDLADEGAQAVASGKEYVVDLGAGLGAIFSAGEKAIGHLKEIDVMTTQQAGASEQMAQTVGEAKEMARHSSNAAEEIHRSMEKITLLVDELNAHLDGKTQ